MKRTQHLTTAVIATIMMFSVVPPSITQLRDTDWHQIMVLDPLEDLYSEGGILASGLEWQDTLALSTARGDDLLYISITVNGEFPPEGSTWDGAIMVLVDINGDGEVVPSEGIIDFTAGNLDYGIFITSPEFGEPPIYVWDTQMPPDVYDTEGAIFSVEGNEIKIEVDVNHIGNPDTISIVAAIRTGFTTELLEDRVPNEGLAHPNNIAVTSLIEGLTVTEPSQTISGYVLRYDSIDPVNRQLNYSVWSLLHNETGTASYLDGDFSFTINLAEGYNRVILDDGVEAETLMFTLDTSAPLVTTSLTDWPISSIRSSSYNVFSDVLSFHVPLFEGCTSKIVENTFDENGRLIGEHKKYFDSDGNTVGEEDTQIDYEEEGLPPSPPRKNLPKTKITKIYDLNGKLIGEFEMSAEGSTSRYYDPKTGKVLREITVHKDGSKTETTYEYTPRCNLKKETTIRYDPDGKIKSTKVIVIEYELDAKKKEREKKRTETEYDKTSGTHKKVTETEYDNGKKKRQIVNRSKVYGGVEITKEVYELKYIYLDGKFWKTEKTPIPTGEPVNNQNYNVKMIAVEGNSENETKTLEVHYSAEKVKVIRTTLENKIEIIEYKFESNFPNFTEPTIFSGEIMISDVSSNPAIPDFGISTIQISIMNSTGSYAENLYKVGSSFDFNVTLSMNTTITIMVVDEAGHMGITAIQVPQPLVTDIDCNYMVNILDISLTAIAFGSEPGNAKWDFFADVNNDNQVNIIDISTVAIDFGRVY